MNIPRRTGTLLVYAGSIGLATTFLVCVYLHEVMTALRGWRCTYEACTVPAAWTAAQTLDVFVLWFGGVRSVLQIRAGLVLQQPTGFDRKGPLVAYLAVAAIDCGLVAAVGVPAWVLALAAGWPLAVYAVTRTAAVRPLVWEPLQLPPARVL